MCVRACVCVGESEAEKDGARADYYCARFRRLRPPSLFDFFARRCGQMERVRGGTRVVVCLPVYFFPSTLVRLNKSQLPCS